MNEKRIDQLLEFYKQDPKDPFYPYALAIEYQYSNPVKAKHYFETLLSDFPDYVPTYFHAAAFFIEQNEMERADAIYHLGIEKAKLAQEHHHLRELSAAYQNFQLEWNDED